MRLRCCTYNPLSLRRAGRWDDIVSQLGACDIIGLPGIQITTSNPVEQDELNGFIRFNWGRGKGAILVQSLVGLRLLAAGVGNALVLYDATNASHCPSHGTLMAFVRAQASDFSVALFGQRLSCAHLRLPCSEGVLEMHLGSGSLPGVSLRATGL